MNSTRASIIRNSKASGRPRVKLAGVTFAYNARVPLFECQKLELFGGDSLAIVGPNGSGKTTFLHILSGVEVPSAGTIEYDGNPVVTFVPTNIDHYLLPWYSVRRNLDFFSRQKQVGASIFERLLPELAGTATSRRVYQLSTGEKAVLAFDCALRTRPNVLILDELFGNLSAEFAKVLIASLKTSLREGLALVFTSHDARVVNGLATKVVNLE